MTICIVNSNSTKIYVNNLSSQSSYSTEIENIDHYNRKPKIASEDLFKYSILSPLTSLLSPFVPSKTSHTNSGIMPPGLLYVSKNYLIFEKPPCYQTIFVTPKTVSEISDSDEPYVYRLPIPWQVYMVQYTSVQDAYYTANVRMHFSNGPILSSDQNIHMAPLTNLYSSGELCRPMYSSMEDIDRYSKDLSGVITSAYDWIWNSGANIDLTSSITFTYSQLKGNYKSTVLQNISDYSLAKSNLYININSYYCNYNFVHDLYSSWEKIPLEQITSLQWPNNSIGKQFFEDFNSARGQHYRSYLNAHQSTQYDCCEECSDYDEEQESYSNQEDCECSCHSGLSDNDLDFYTYAGVWPIKNMTYSQAFENFISTTSPSINEFNLPGYNTIIDSITLSS